MGICFRCEKESVKLFDSITNEGIVGLCRDCADEALVLKKPKSVVIPKDDTFRERLSSFEKTNFLENPKKINNEQDEELKKIITKNIEKDLEESFGEDILVRNFHWAVMRARRLRKLTINELAKKISEPVNLIVFIEKGRVSKKHINLLRKLELFFNIELFTNDARKKFVRPFSEVGFDPIFSRSLTIDDLMEMKKKRESEN